MNAIVLLSSPRPPTPPDDDGFACRTPANDDVLAAVGAIRGPEIALAISFAGLTEAEQRRALASFPGARRCIIAAA